MSIFTDKLRLSCLAEWDRFEKGTKTETQDPQFKFVGEYWQSIGKNLDGKTVIEGKRPAWSSAFVSFVVRTAGAGNRFRYAEAHCHYVKNAMDFADSGVGNYGYRARKFDEYRPKVGDIIVAGREYAKQYTYAQAKLIYEADGFYPSHGDVVVAVSADKVTTMGGNVSTDTVGRRFRAVKPNGQLMNRVESGITYPWIAVLECLI